MSLSVSASCSIMALKVSYILPALGLAAQPGSIPLRQLLRVNRHIGVLF
jgi:hypothetical protein